MTCSVTKVVPDNHQSNGSNKEEVTKKHENRQAMLIRNKQKRFLVFIEVLLKSLDKTFDDAANPTQKQQMKQRAKLIVTECIKKNRQGDPNYSPLQESIESRLREVVGDTRWKRANQILMRYMNMSKEQIQTARQQHQQCQPAK